MGSWKLNEAKSKIAAGASKNLTVVYTVAGDSFKCVVDGVDGAGKPTHNEWIGKFDGNDYPVTGDPAADTRSIRMVRAGHYALSNKKGGKTVVTGTIDLSADGKTRTLITEMTDASGKKMTSIAVYGRALSRHIRAVTGTVPKFEMCPGLLETRFYAQRGMPGYAYGPGLSSVSHGPKEFVDTDRIVESAAVYARVAAEVLHDS